jgi:rubredoxin
MQYRFTLQPYAGMASRYTCPRCNARKTFTRYIDTQTGQHLGPAVGCCNRLINCGYHYKPKQFFADHGSLPADYGMRQSSIVTRPLFVNRAPSFISNAIVYQSLGSLAPNNFITYLTGLFGAEITAQLAGRYYIGTARHWPGATVFWQVDDNQNVRTGKIMLYNPDTGKRIKEPRNYITWAHCLLKQPSFNLQQCLFGQHLLKGNTQPVAIVESEKTAVIASIYLPKFIWLATGSLSNLNPKKCQALKGRNVTLFPDLNAYDKWRQAAYKLYPITRYYISDLLERRATPLQRQQGLDLADCLVQFDYREFLEGVGKEHN